MLLSNYLIAAQVNYQLTSGYFIELKNFKSESEQSVSQFFWSNDEYLFVNLKLSDDKRRSVIMEIPFDIGLRPRQWNVGFMLPIWTHFSAGLSFGQTENTVMIENINRLISSKHPELSPIDEDLDNADQYARFGYALSANIGFEKTKGKIFLEQKFGFGIGSLQEFSFDWQYSDPESNLILYDKYTFDAARQYLIQGKTGLFVHLKDTKKIRYELGYSGVYRMDFTQEKTNIDQFRWTITEIEKSEYAGLLKTQVFRHYISLRMTLLK